MSEFVQGFTAPHMASPASLPARPKRNYTAYLSMLADAFAIAQRCQAELNSKGQIDPITLDSIRDEVGKWA
ncbi:MAG: hypothetical protein HQ483_04575 [Rhodospirillales bacterium]|nr:hypothetical protein [Rhodospirillales bacterium]